MSPLCLGAFESSFFFFFFQAEDGIRDYKVTGVQTCALPIFGGSFVHFSAHTRMSGVNIGERQIRKGAVDAVARHVEALGQTFPKAVLASVQEVARRGSTPLIVSDGARALGVIELKDTVKGGIRERFGELRRMGIRTIMITGDNPLTAAAIAAEAGVDGFLAEATPEAKLKLIRAHQGEGRLVAMTGDGTNDAPALAQDDVAKYFAIIPAAFVTTYPQLNALNVMHLASPFSAILSAVIFNALIIVCLIPLALQGVRYRALGAAILLRRNLLVYGLGGILVPFAGIKLVDLGLVLAHL